MLSPVQQNCMAKTVLPVPVKFWNEFPSLVREQCRAGDSQLWPHAEDVLAIAQSLFESGQVQRPEQVLPQYLREEISWKKLSQQGKA